MLSATQTLSFSSARVSPMTEADVADVLAIERRCNSHPWSERNFRDALASGYLCLIAREACVPCGFAVGRMLLDEAELLLIAVLPEIRRQGVATLLWNELALRLYASGARRIHLEVRQSNTGAQRFYAMRGFTIEGIRGGYYPSGTQDSRREDALLMQVALHSASAHAGDAAKE